MGVRPSLLPAAGRLTAGIIRQPIRTISKSISKTRNDVENKNFLRTVKPSTESETIIAPDKKGCLLMSVRMRDFRMVTDGRPICLMAAG